MPSTITELRSVAGRSSDALTTLHARLMSEIPQLVFKSNCDFYHVTAWNSLCLLEFLVLETRMCACFE